MSSASERDITEMTRTAEFVFQHSGIDTRWFECSSQAQRGRVLILFVGSAPTSGSSRALGSATLNSPRISVFFDQAKNVSIREGISVSAGQVMGYMLAHEVCHAILRSRHHALHGIMKAPYTRRDLVKMSQSNLFFTSEETGMLRSELLGGASGQSGELVASDR